jgi:hypothetical protein
LRDRQARHDSRTRSSVSRPSTRLARKVRTVRSRSSSETRQLGSTTEPTVPVANHRMEPSRTVWLIDGILTKVPGLGGLSCRQSNISRSQLPVDTHMSVLFVLATTPVCHSAAPAGDDRRTSAGPSSLYSCEGGSGHSWAGSTGLGRSHVAADREFGCCDEGPGSVLPTVTANSSSPEPPPSHA